MAPQMTKLIHTLTIVFLLGFAGGCGNDAANQTSSPGQTTVQPLSQPLRAQGQPVTAPTTPRAADTQSGPAPPLGPSATDPFETVNVVTTNNIVADLVSEVGGERVNVYSLLPPGSDPHNYRPGARDITRVADADLVVVVGLSLEAHWLDELLENAASNPDRTVVLGDVVEPIESAELFGHDEDSVEHDADEVHDPHFWFDPQRAKLAVNEIESRLISTDPSGSALYRTNAQAYRSKLDELHHWIIGELAAIPVERRLFVTSHDSFRYFAQEYGFEVIGAVIPGGNTEREPSAQEMAELVDDIKLAGVRAVFTENTIPDTLAHRIADEAGAAVVTRLYTGSLGALEGEAGTYMDFMRYNVATIVAALK